MYSSMCYMTIVALLVMDVRTGALQELDIPPSRCYNCRANDTASCNQTSSWTVVTCNAKRPLCATTASSPDFHSSLICASVVNTPCMIKTSSNSVTVTWVCDNHLCNSPFTPQLRSELINFTSNNTDVKDHNMCNLITKFKNVIDQDNIVKTSTTEEVKTSTTKAKSTSEPSPVSVSTTMNFQLMLRDSERPRAEALKQQPTVPSDDDEDESEGSGSYEEARFHNHAVSAPAAPSSFLPANENNARPLFKHLLIAPLFIYVLV